MKVQRPDVEYEKDLVRSHRQALAQREKHLQQVDSGLKEEEVKLREQSAARSQEIRNVSRQELLNSQVEKENQLLDLDKNFRKTAEEMKQQLDLVKFQNDERLQELGHSDKARFDREYQANVRQLEQQTDAARTQMIKLGESSKQDLEGQMLRSQDALSASSSEHERRYLNQNNSNRIEMDTLRRNQSKEQAEAQAEFLHNKEFQSKIQARQLEKMQAEFNSQMKLEVGSQNGVMRTTREDFEKKYADLLNFQNQRMLDMEERYKKEMELIQANYNAQKAFIEKRSSDPFYQTITLKTNVTDNPDHYVVHVPLPEHEAENIQIGGNKREIKLTFNRRYQGEVDVPETGDSYQSKNYQSVIKIVKVPEIIDPNSINRKYENGMVKFFVKKA